MMLKKNQCLSNMLLLLLMMASSFVYAEDLIIANGENYTVKVNQREIHLKKLIIGDKATIKFAEGVTYWDVSADEVEVGEGVFIDGRGRDGAAGSGTLPIVERASDCKGGSAGVYGAAGVMGGNGVDIQMKLTVTRFGSMKINVNGGNGGIGADGSKGQQGGVAKSCNPTDGGKGGNGGLGGNGGNGGKLIVSLSALQSQSLMAMSHRIEASADAGQGAAGGKPGAGGEGSEGQFINQKTLTGDKKWVSGGKKGDVGIGGEKGTSGHEGRVFIGGGELNVSAITQNTASAASVAKQPAVQSAESGQMEELRAQLKLLENRIEMLEKTRK